MARIDGPEGVLGRCLRVGVSLEDQLHSLGDPLPGVRPAGRLSGPIERAVLREDLVLSLIHI
eukprot:6616025-Alexandrium_andersonii.AAC.1